MIMNTSQNLLYYAIKTELFRNLREGSLESFFGFGLVDN